MPGQKIKDGEKDGMTDQREEDDADNAARAFQDIKSRGIVTPPANSVSV